MPLIVLLGGVILIAAVGLVLTSGGADNNSGVVSFLDKLKNFASESFKPAAANKENADKYEKSDDGKVVYAFKPKSGESDTSDAAGTSQDDDNEDSTDEDA